MDAQTRETKLKKPDLPDHIDLPSNLGSDCRQYFSNEHPVHELIDKQVLRTPERTAVTIASESISYKQLSERSNQLANFLIRIGIQKKDFVAICLPRSIDMIISLLAVLKTGSAYIPIDPCYPRERIELMLTNESIKAVITDGTLPKNINNIGAMARIDLGEVWPTINKEKKSNPKIETSLDDPVYAIYTSGSTGRPKAAVVCHRGFTNLIHWYVCEMCFTEAHKTLLISSLSFDLTQKNIFTPLVVGSELILSDYQYFDPFMIRNEILKHQVNWINCAPSVFYAVCESAQAAELKKLESIQTVVLGGEPIHLARLGAWLGQKKNPVRLVNSYGPTECSDVTAFYVMDKPRSYQKKDIPIGKNIAHVKMHLLDEEGALILDERVGEIAVSGRCVGLGYMHNQSLTDQKFVHRGAIEGKVYLTGDLGRYDENGNIVFVGRKDHQVKIRGFRIELGEIESVLNGYPDIKQSIVCARQKNLARSSDDNILVAFIQWERVEKECRTDELGTYLKNKLPAYMVPSYFVPMEDFPQLPSGKIDRKKLITMDLPLQKELVKEQDQGEDAISKVILNIWREVLDDTSVGMSDDFFHCGGQSLLATQIISRICQHFKIYLPLRSIFDNPTVSGLSRIIAQMMNQPSTIPNACEPILPVERNQTVWPMSFAQQRLWFLDRLEGPSPTYNLAFKIQLRGNFDTELFRRTVAIITRRHEILRTTFSMIDNRPCQKIHEEMVIPFEEVDLTDQTDKLAENLTQALIEEDARRPFDLANGPLFRFLALKRKDDQYTLMFNMHHIISDAWSMEILWKECQEIYTALGNKVPVSQPESGIQYLDYAVWQKKGMEDRDKENQLQYWK
ncbi:MAG: amino acid adenylation domain-containing protein, partial [Candidatus Omnitrophica bacterium]|nr:amino acid adenylation domain-containing protein [Candidatus Omnitrophota bacterium]